MGDHRPSCAPEPPELPPGFVVPYAGWLQGIIHAQAAWRGYLTRQWIVEVMAGGSDSDEDDDDYWERLAMKCLQPSCRGPLGRATGFWRIHHLLSQNRNHAMLSRRDVEHALLNSPKFRAILQTMVQGGFDSAEPILQLVLRLLAQPTARLPRRSLLQIALAVNDLLQGIARQPPSPKALKLLKNSLIAVAFLTHWLPSSFDLLPGKEVSSYLRRHAPTSVALELWRLLLERHALRSPPTDSESCDMRSTLSPSSSSSPTATPAEFEVMRSPSVLLENSTTFSSDDGDTTTYMSLVSDDEDVPGKPTRVLPAAGH